jgi:hypothetical protein
MARSFLIQRKKKGPARAIDAEELRVPGQNVSLRCVGGPVKQQVRLVQPLRRQEYDIPFQWPIRLAIEH